MADAAVLADNYAGKLTHEIERVTELLIAEHGTRDANFTHASVCRIFGRLFFDEARVAQMAAGTDIVFTVVVPPPQLENGACACLLCEAVANSTLLMDTWDASDPVQEAARNMLRSAFG